MKHLQVGNVPYVKSHQRVRGDFSSKTGYSWNVNCDMNLALDLLMDV